MRKSQPQHIVNDELLTVAEVARILRLDGTTVRRHIRDGLIEAIALPQGGIRQRSAYRVKRSTLDAILNPPKTA